jgi:hypothetical protein
VRGAPGAHLEHQIVAVLRQLGGQAHLQGLGRRDVFTLGTDLQRRLLPQQPRQALGAAAAGQQAQLTQQSVI